MTVIIGVPKETVGGETRVATVPEVVKKFKALGAEFCIETGAGQASHFRDEDFGGNIVTSATALADQSQVVFRVTPPSVEEINTLKPGTVLVGYLAPYGSKERIAALKAKNITSFAVELIPRISRAQSMDALSSQAAVAGYKTVLIAANACPKFFPMLTYAAGTIRPARVLVIGAGVAGLQAIATAKRLGPSSKVMTCGPKPRSKSNLSAPSSWTLAYPRPVAAATPGN